MSKKFVAATLYLFLFVIAASAQINTERVMAIGRNALYFEDYVLSIQYFNQVIKVKPYLAEPYFFRGIAKLNLEDYKGAEEDCTLCLERNPFIINAYQARGIARQNLGNYQGAIDDYVEGLRFSPENRTFLINKAIAEAQLKKMDDAQASFDRLIQLHPSFYNGYLTRGQFYLEKGDTVQALQDMNKAIELDKYLPYAYAQRAIVKLQHNRDYKEALADMDEALKLDPSSTAFYINRGLIRYHLNDLRGTMSDYDRALELEPGNKIARYNRGLLRAQVGDKNRAIDDFTKVIEADPENYFAYYNRAILRDEAGDYRGAVSDYSVVLKEYPSFLPGYFARSEARRKMNDKKGAEADFMYAMNLEKEEGERRQEGTVNAGRKNDSTDEDEEETDPDEKIRRESDRNIRKFNRILVADNNEARKYDSELRGRVQDKNVNVELEAPFILSYYERGDKVRQHVFYNKQLEDFNRSGLLKKVLRMTNDEVPLSSYQVNEHFTSIDDYSKLIEINPSNPLPYFGRATDFMLVQDFSSALEDLNRVIMISPRFVFAYFNRAAVRFKQIEYKMSAETQNQTETTSLSTLNLANAFDVRSAAKQRPADPGFKPTDSRAVEYEMVLRDYDKVIELDPQSVYAYFNRANVRCVQKDYRAALVDFNEAIRIDPEFAEAYFNRGLVYLYLGETKKGIEDLSKAGELGIISAYNLIKRVSEK